MNLPRAEHADIEKAKITDYLLELEHPDGSSKARFFREFGFSPAEWQTMADSLTGLAKEHPVIKSVETRRGTKYIVDGRLATPDGRKVSVRTVWIVETGRINPQFVTAHPRPKDSDEN